ncbi:hypothetical protein EJB05_14592, partial [Eragrostis curvula]
MEDGGAAAAVIVAVLFLNLIACSCVIRYRGRAGTTVVPDDNRIRHMTIEKVIWEIRHEKPFRFTPEQLAGFTNNYSTRLGVGGFGAVFKGALPNGLAVVVKVFHCSLDQKSGEEQFIAEVGTIGRTHHVNLVRLFGFCFDDALCALVYEFMELGALDAFLLHRGRDVGVEALSAISCTGAHLHEEGREKIVHYDIKPGNILLDAALMPKVADFGLARLVNHAATHVTMSRPRGTPGFASPAGDSGVTEKCDVYSFGMLLLEIIGLRRNFDEAAPESQRWFPKLAWTKYEDGKLMELVPDGSRDAAAGDVVQGREMLERLYKVAFWCVQEMPEARPLIGVVVKMLEGEMDIAPPINPFQHLMMPPVWTLTATSDGSGNGASANVISEGRKSIVNVVKMLEGNMNIIDLSVNPFRHALVALDTGHRTKMASSGNMATASGVATGAN